MEITGWLIYSKKDAQKNKSYIQWMIAEADKQNIHLTLVFREQLTIGVIEQNPQAVIHNQYSQLPMIAIVRTIEPMLNIHLESLGIQVFNSSTIATLCNHKSLTHLAINKLHIPMVQTLFMNKNCLPQTPPLSFPFVVKDARGRGGKHVYLVNNVEQWEASIEKIETKDFLVQTCDVQHGRDVRVFVVGKKIIGAVLRKSTADFRANYTLGGSATWYELRRKDREIVQRIVNYFNFGMVGIDFLLDKDGQLLFNEIEDVVGSRTLSVVSDINILEHYMDYIQTSYQQFPSRK